MIKKQPAKTALSKAEKSKKTKKGKKIQTAGLSRQEQGIMSVARSYGTGSTMSRRLDTLRRQVESGLISVGERQQKLNGMTGKKKYGE